MGAGVSAGENNDDLIDNLIESNYIKTTLVERVFRAVDRGAYFLPDQHCEPYRDVAWKSGNLHISAPCIYSEVMEGLKLKPGLSFLNLGSGTGYLSTLAGLILGSYGVNHGIELHQNVVEYAYKKLDEFKRFSGALDEFDFCEPKFLRGNCLNLSVGFHTYDRVYCGAACPELYLKQLKNLVNVGGILVVPINERLMELRHTSENNWSSHYLLPVSFTNLVYPEEENREFVPNFDLAPLSLEELCRSTIRNILRENILIEAPHLHTNSKIEKPIKKKKPLKRERADRRDGTRSSEELLDFFLLTIARKKKRANVTMSHEGSEASTSSSANNLDSENPSTDSDDSSFGDPQNEAPSCSKQTDQVLIHERNPPEQGPPCTGNINRKFRKKFDSGLGDELEIAQIVESSSSEDECYHKRQRSLPRNFQVPHESSDSESDNEVQDNESSNERRKIYQSPFTEHMKSKIQLLPLPSNVKKFLHFYRDF